MVQGIRGTGTVIEPNVAIATCDIKASLPSRDDDTVHTQSSSEIHDTVKRPLCRIISTNPHERQRN